MTRIKHGFAAAAAIASLSASCLVAGVAGAEPNDAKADAAPQHSYARALDKIRDGEARKIRIVLDGYVPPTTWLPQILGGRAVIDARITPDNYAVDSRVTAAGIVGWFVDYSSNLNSRGRITEDGVAPIYYQALDDEGKKNRSTRITYRADQVDVDVQPPHGDLGDPPATEEQKLEAVDPMSALMHMAMNPNATAEDPCQNIVQIFDGKGRYNLHLTKAGYHDNYDAPGWRGPAFTCSVKYEEVAGYEKKTPEEKRALQHDLKWIHITLADLGPGEPRVPIKIEARSRKRGKITLVAREVSISPLETDRAEIKVDPEGSRG